MKHKFISKLIAGTIVSTTLSTFIPVKASAEWVNDYQGNWYYIENNQRMTGWKRIDGQIYYFDDNGKMQTGWINAGNSWYFLQNSGELKRGWFQYNKNWYYSDINGAVQTGILNIDGKIYIFDDNGVMKTTNCFINGQFYTIGSKGEVAGYNLPTPDKEYDSAGNCLAVLKNTDNKVSVSPTEPSYNEEIKDQSVSDEDPNEGRKFSVKFKDSNGAELKTMSVKNGKSVDLYKPTKIGFVFASWNTKSDGSGKSYDDDDDIKVKEDINLYAQWTTDSTIFVKGITIKGGSYVTVNSTSQMTVDISPSDAANKGVKWSVDDTSKAQIDSNGVLKGLAAGKVVVTATSIDGTSISAKKEVTVSVTDVVIPVEKVEVTSATGAYEIKGASSATLQMQANVTPNDATNPKVTWSIENEDGTAEIDDNGLVTAKSNGHVKVTATAGGVSSQPREIIISGLSTVIPVEKVDVTTLGIDSSSEVKITTDSAAGGTNGKLKMIATISPNTASVKTVTWSVETINTPNHESNITGDAKIDTSGNLTAISNGIVKVIATSVGVGKDGSCVIGERIVRIENQTIKVESFDVIGDKVVNGNPAITDNGGTITMQLNNILPTGATYKSIAWTVAPAVGTVNGPGNVQINSTSGAACVLTAVANGDVDVTATITAQDGTKKLVTKRVSISGQTATYDLQSIKIKVKNGTQPEILTDDGLLDITAELTPYYANFTPANITWEAIGGSGKIVKVSADGKTATLKAIANGNVNIRASYTLGSKTIVCDQPLQVSISNQFEQVSKIIVTTQNGILKVEKGGILQMTATTTPANRAVKWEVVSAIGDDVSTASIGEYTGLLKGITVGTTNPKVKVRAVSRDQYAYASDPIEIEVVEPVTISGITVNASYDQITDNAGSTTLTAVITNAVASGNNPAATNQTVTWTVDPYTGVNGEYTAGSADIVNNADLTAKLTAKTNGYVKVKATANDNGKAYGEKVIQISGQKATGLTVKGLNGVSIISVLGNTGALQMTYDLIPSNATTPAAVTWTVNDGSIASINPSTGVLTGIKNGIVTVTATSSDFNIKNSANITVDAITGIAITGGSIQNGIITTTKGSAIKLSATVTRSKTTTEGVTWSVSSASGKASITTDGVISDSEAENVIVRATATDGSGKYTETTIAFK